jgi:hypothetical protein
LAFYEAEVDEGVSSIELVADDGMAEVGEVDAKLVFPPGL